MKIGICKRVGIEVELRTYSIKDNIHNKIVLAETHSKIIDMDLNISYLQLVSEGEGSGTSYFELVFGAIKYEDLYQVRNVIKIAREVYGCNNITDWINKFNRSIRQRSSQQELVNYILTQQAGTNHLRIKEENTNSVSIQANILVPVASFAYKDKVNTIFSGMGDCTFPFAFVFDQIKKHLSQNVTDTIKGAIFIAIYVCSIYSLNCLELHRPILKQHFPILFKVELTTLLKALVPIQIIDSLNTTRWLLEIITKIQYNRTEIFQKNMMFLAENVRQASPNIQITPRTSGVLPMYWYRTKACIVVELRKGESRLLESISKFLLDTPNLLKSVKPVITKPIPTRSIVGQQLQPKQPIVKRPAVSTVTKTVNIPDLLMLW